MPHRVPRDLLVRFGEGLVRERIGDPLEGDAPDDAVAERLDGLAALDDGLRLDAVEGAAVALVDDHVLRDVDETAREVARVRGLQRRSASPLRAPCVEMKYCSTVRPSRKFDVIASR